MSSSRSAWIRRDGKQSGTEVGFQFDLTRNTTRNLLDASRATTPRCTWNRLAGGYRAATTSTRRRWTCATTSPSSAVSSLPPASRPAASTASDRGSRQTPHKVPFSRRYFLGGHQPARVGAPRSEPDHAVWPPDWRVEHARGERGTAHGDHAQSQLRGLRRRGQLVGPPLANPAGRSARRGGAGGALSHADRPIRADFGYQLTPIEALLVNGERETRPLARALQHRAGILTWMELSWS